MTIQTLLFFIFFCVEMFSVIKSDLHEEYSKLEVYRKKKILHTRTKENFCAIILKNKVILGKM